jgi:Skp family chaperone for outer membrane proteins
MARLPILLVLPLLVGVRPAFAQGAAAAKPTPPPAPIAAAPLPVDTKIAFVNLQIVFNESVLGREGQERRRILNEKLFAGLTARDKEIQGLREKIKSQQGVIETTVLRAWNNELQRLEREAQFAQQEAQVQSNQLWEDVLETFEARLVPIVDALRVEKGLHAIFAIQNENSGLSLLSVDRGLDLSAEVVKRLNAK